MIKPVLLFAYGNPSRGDDALGPRLLEFVEKRVDSRTIDLLTDFQLQIEHALDLDGRELVLFADASVSGDDAFHFSELKPSRILGYTSHAMNPEAVMAVYRSITKRAPPPCFLLGIQGESFELGENLSSRASRNLEQACYFAEHLLTRPKLSAWRQLTVRGNRVWPGSHA